MENFVCSSTRSAKPVFPGLRLLCAWRPPPISQVPGGGICLLFFYVVAMTALSETSVPQERSLRSAIRMSIKSQATFSTELLLGSVAEAPFAASFGLV